MAISRRKLLEMGAVGLPLAAAVGSGSRLAAASTPPLRQATGGILLLVEGLGVLITHGPEKKPTSASLVLTSPQGLVITHEGSPLTLPPHHPTLGVRRTAVMGGSAEPTAGTPDHVFYSLDRKDVSFRYLATASPTSADRATPFEARTTDVGDACNPTPDNWKSIEWMPKIARDIKPGAKLSRRWNESKYVQSAIRFEMGRMECSDIPNNAPGGPQTSRKWDVKGSDNPRRFKEVLRHLIPGPGFLHITLTPRLGHGPQETIIVEAQGELQPVSITQLPKPNAHGGMLHDLVAYLSLTAADGMASCMDGACLPKESNKDCGQFVTATSSCGCCPVAMINDSDAAL